MFIINVQRDNVDNMPINVENNDIKFEDHEELGNDKWE